MTNDSNQTTPAIWRLAFRPFFLVGAFFSIIAIGLWWAMQKGYVSPEVYGGGLWWHAHEMIFGFACAIIAGFLLTAVQSWTGLPGLRGRYLIALFGVWTGARLLMFLPVPPTFVALLDVLFLPTVVVALAIPIIKVKSYRNLVFAPLLLLLTSLNIVSHYALNVGINFLPFFHGAIVLIIVIVSVLGGRVIPFFTARGLKVEQVEPHKFIGFSAIGLTVVLAVIAVFGFSSVPQWLLQAVVCISLIAHSLRLFYWFNKGILTKPILWSLHLAYSFIPLGLLLMALQSFGWLVNGSAVIHSFTVGTIGGLILAMISRVTLGHTGRPLVLPKLMSLAFICIFASAFIRVLLPIVDITLYGLAIDSATFLWGAAFAIFIMCYGSMLVSVRVDGKLG